MADSSKSHLTESQTSFFPPLKVREIITDREIGFGFSVAGGEQGFDRIISHPRIQKSGLALVGHFHGIVTTRIQIVGQTELSFLLELSPNERRIALRGFFNLGLSCVIICQPSFSFEPDSSGMGMLPVPELYECAAESNTPLLSSVERSSITINALHSFLDSRLAPRTRLHGVLVDIFGIGVLIRGQSAIGKSECALELVMRGHRLVADDAVECDFRPPGMIFGTPAKLLRYHLEVRGLGILNIKDLFGVTAIRERKRIDISVRLIDSMKEVEQDRLGLEEKFFNILGVPIRELTIPVRPGRDMASILEIAARNELLRSAGHNTTQEFVKSLEQANLFQHKSPVDSESPPSSIRLFDADEIE